MCCAPCVRQAIGLAVQRVQVPLLGRLTSWRSLWQKPTTHFNTSASNIKSLLDAKLLIPGSVFHLWGHSYELAGTGMTTFRSTLGVLANNPSVWYATLGDLMVWRYTHQKLQIDSKDKSFIFVINIIRL